MRPLSVLIPTAIAAISLTACGTEGVSVPTSDTAEHDGAEIFATHCAGCHTISAAGTQKRRSKTAAPTPKVMKTMR